MKEVPLQEWAKRLLEDQVNRLGALRNANPRDPSFKLWRQTTLTVIQRLWPGNLPRSEQFRRIAFTTPSARASRTQVREHYERGCGEAVGYLRGLMLEIEGGALSLPASDPATSPPDLPSPPVAPAPLHEVPTNSPLLDEGLVGSGPLEALQPEPVASPPPHFLSPAFDRDPEFRRPTPPAQELTAEAITDFNPAPATEPEPGNAAPRVTSPRLTVVSSTQARSAEAPPPAMAAAATPPPPAPATPPPPPRAAAPPPPPAARATPPQPAPAPSMPPPVAETPARTARRSDKRPLKEMLGFVDAYTPPARPAEPTSPTASDAGLIPPRPAPAFGTPPGQAPARNPVAPGPSHAPSQDPPVQEEREAWIEPETETVHDPLAELEPDPFAREDEDSEDGNGFLEGGEFDDGEAESEAPETTAANEATVESQAPGAVETAEPLRTSAVLTAQARPPAPRPGAEPAGTAVAAVLNALAADVTRLGVPEGQRAATRATLVGLGRQFDQGTANWSSVRQTIMMVLEYPTLARLLIPSLVPYLDLD